MFAIIISEKGGPERREAYDKSEINVGRVQGNDLMLPKGNVSKHHARLLFRDGRFIVTDLKSTNGTYVNGKKIAQATVVREGDKIFIGDFVIRLEGAQDVAGAPPPASDGPHDESTLAREREPNPPPLAPPDGLAGPASAGSLDAEAGRQRSGRDAEGLHASPGREAGPGAQRGPGRATGRGGRRQRDPQAAPDGPGCRRAAAPAPAHDASEPSGPAGAPNAAWSGRRRWAAAAPLGGPSARGAPRSRAFAYATASARRASQLDASCSARARRPSACASGSALDAPAARERAARGACRRPGDDRSRSPARAPRGFHSASEPRKERRSASARQLGQDRGAREPRGPRRASDRPRAVEALGQRARRPRQACRGRGARAGQGAHVRRRARRGRRRGPLPRSRLGARRSRADRRHARRRGHRRDPRAAVRPCRRHPRLLKLGSRERLLVRRGRRPRASPALRARLPAARRKRDGRRAKAPERRDGARCPPARVEERRDLGAQEAHPRGLVRPPRPPKHALEAHVRVPRGRRGGEAQRARRRPFVGRFAVVRRGVRARLGAVRARRDRRGQRRDRVRSSAGRVVPPWARRGSRRRRVRVPIASCSRASEGPRSAPCSTRSGTGAKGSSRASRRAA
jgi:hypothetical protein